MPEPLDLDAIEARANAATEGPWAIEWDEDDVTDTPFPVSIGPIGYLEHRGEREAADAEFVAAARADVPALVGEARRLWGLLEAAHCRLHYIAARLERVDVRDDPTGFVGDVGPYLDGPLHPSDLAAYRAATAPIS